MKVLRVGLIAGAGSALVAASLFVVRVPDDTVAVLEAPQGGEILRILQPGVHLRSIGARLVTYSTQPLTAAGEVMVTPATGGEIPLRFSVTGRIDPDRAADLHRALRGRLLQDFLAAQAATLLRGEAARARPAEILTPGFRSRAAEAIGAAMRRSGLAEADLTIPPPDDDTLLAAARYLARRGKADAIRATIAEALRDPERAGGWKLLTAMGFINESEKLFAEAEKNYLDALAIEPTALPPMGQLVTLYSAVSDWSRLQRILDAALTVDPNSLQLINWTAVVLLKQGDHAGAERILKNGLELDPANTTLLANLGALYLKTDRTEEALDLFRRAVEADPASPQALFNLGSALAAADRFDEARPYLERAEAAGPMTAPLARTLATVYDRTGQSAKADLYRRKAEELERRQASPRQGAGARRHASERKVSRG